MGNELQEETVSREISAAFNLLMRIVVSHLPKSAADLHVRQLKMQLKMVGDPIDVFATWIGENNDSAAAVGVIALDWKAREEINWQAKILAEAHGLTLAWVYDVDADTEWMGWQERNEVPVKAPLRRLGAELSTLGLVLYRFDVDDSMFAFAVAKDKSGTVHSLCKTLGINAVS